MRRLAALLLATGTACEGNVVVGADGSGAPGCADVCAKIEAACPGKTGNGCASTCAGIDAEIADGGPCSARVATWLGCLDQDPSSPCTPNGSCLADEQSIEHDCP